MEYQIQVGKIAFHLSLPFPYRWREEDHRFMNPASPAELYVTITAIGEELTLPEEEPVSASASLRVWERDGAEVRAYNATFCPGRPLYAVSRREGAALRIGLTGDLNILMNPNMKIWNLLHLENFLLDTCGIVLHSCYTMYRNEAILFTAPSGTGKTTHAKLWKKCYGSKIVNGDKCLLQLHKNAWQAWGYPYHGSADECDNENYPLRAIVIIRQDSVDWVEEIGPARRLGLLYSECTVNSWNRERVRRALGLLTDLVTKVPVLILHCTMNDNAAHVLHNYLYGGDNGTV